MTITKNTNSISLELSDQEFVLVQYLLEKIHNDTKHKVKESLALKMLFEMQKINL